MEKMIEKFRNLPDDRIGDDIFIAFMWSDNILIRIFLGSKKCGPMLQFYCPREDFAAPEYSLTINGPSTVSTDIPPYGHLYDGHVHKYFHGGGWTNCYSRGNFGKNYAHGGNWSGHTKNLHPRLMVSPVIDIKSELLSDGEGGAIELPAGIKGDISVTDMDCSGGWSIFYHSAKTALYNRLKRDEISTSSLPGITKSHLLANETDDVIEALRDVLEAYDL